MQIGAQQTRIGQHGAARHDEGLEPLAFVRPHQAHARVLHVRVKAQHLRHLGREDIDPSHLHGIILAATGMPPGRLELEATKSLAAQGQDIQQRLHALKAMGIRLALDDFGTGYSSLSSLHLLPVGTPKIDRSFVSQADTSRHHRVLIEATVKVAQSLGMQTVAEGIETQSQAGVVRAQACTKARGYSYRRPLSAPDLLAWLGERHPFVA